MNAAKHIHRKAGTKNNSANTAPILECTLADALCQQIETQAFDAPVTIHFNSHRRRFTDMDNLSGKDLLDGMVRLKILSDDRSKYVQEITHTQTFNRAEGSCTIITITAK